MTLDPLAPACERPVFVVGASRAGTTWLQTLLTLHPRLFSRAETKLFQHALDPRPRLTFDEMYPDARKPVPAYVTPEHLRTVLAHLADIGFLRVEEELRAGLEGVAAEGRLTPGALLNALMQHAGPGKPGATRWIEKTPRHIFFLEDVFRAFPRAQVVCIYRDIAEQSASAKKTFGYPVLLSLEDAYRSYRAFEAFRDANPALAPQLLAVDYEDLRASPRATLERIFAFLGEEPLGLDDDELRAASKERFQEVYAGTGMLGWQPGMTKQDAPPPVNVEDVYAIARLRRERYAPYVHPAVAPRLRLGLAAGALGEASLFRARRLVADTLVRARRRWRRA